MMTQKLKIKVKETIEEKRLLNDAEREVYDIFCMTNEEHIKIEIGEFWRVQGFNWQAYDGNEGTFRKEVIRDATPDEEIVAHIKRIFKLCNIPMSDKATVRFSGPFSSCVYTGEYLIITLKDKQILLEIEESEPQLKKNSPVINAPLSRV